MCSLLLNTIGWIPDRYFVPLGKEGTYMFEMLHPLNIFLGKSRLRIRLDSQ